MDVDTLCELITGMRDDDSEENRDSGMLANEELFPLGGSAIFPPPHYRRQCKLNLFPNQYQEKSLIPFS